MSIGPMGMASAAAGSQLAQTNGSEREKRADDAARQSATNQADKKAEQAAVGEAEQDQGTDDRDADGRRIWEAANRAKSDDSPENTGEPNGDSIVSKDHTGDRGNQLDLSG